jgi:hypothetical protein
MRDDTRLCYRRCPIIITQPNLYYRHILGWIRILRFLEEKMF